MRYRYAISSTGTEGSFVYLFTVPVVAPLNLYKQYTKIQPLGNGGERHAGWPIDLWSWASLEESERTFFRGYCPGVYQDDMWIYTLNDNNVWVVARTIMFWHKEAEQWSADNTLGFQLTFKVKLATALDI